MFSLGLSVIYFYLMSGQCVTGGQVQIRTQLFVKVRPGGRLADGVVLAEFEASDTSAPMCASVCQLQNAQNFDFGCETANISVLEQNCFCRVYMNVPPLLEAKFFQNNLNYDYYEVSLPELPEDYTLCISGSNCVDGAFCKQVTERIADTNNSNGSYRLASVVVCYKTYLNTTNATSWDNARNACSSEGGKLVEPADAKEQQLLLRLMRRMSDHPNYGQPPASPPSIWIGCSGKSPVWLWQDGSNVTKTFWNGRNPDSIRPINCCASLYQDVTLKTFWIDRNCNDKIAFMCVYQIGV